MCQTSRFVRPALLGALALLCAFATAQTPPPGGDAFVVRPEPAWFKEKWVVSPAWLTKIKDECHLLKWKTRLDSKSAKASATEKAQKLVNDAEKTFVSAKTDDNLAKFILVCAYFPNQSRQLNIKHDLIKRALKLKLNYDLIPFATYALVLNYTPAVSFKDQGDRLVEYFKHDPLMLLSYCAESQYRFPYSLRHDRALTYAEELLSRFPDREEIGLMMCFAVYYNHWMVSKQKGVYEKALKLADLVVASKAVPEDRKDHYRQLKRQMIEWGPDGFKAKPH
jgi:hypothetical protein